MPARSTYGAELERTKRLLGVLLAAVVAIAAIAWALGWATPVDVALLVAFSTAIAAMGFYAQRRTERILGAEIARRKEAEQETRAADLAKSRFLATMSHELRTPLSTVIGSADLLLAGTLPPAVRRNVETVETAAEALRALIDDILDFAKLDTGKLRFASVDFHLRELIAEIHDLSRPRAQAKGLTVSVAVDEDVPASLNGDPARLRQVLLNLVGNAIKFTAEGGVDVHVARDRDGGERSERARGRHWLRFTVRDTGIGIAPAAQRRVFESFFQADSSDARRVGGSGLGLAISKDLVTGMGGEIGLTSEQGTGSTFFFVLPLGEARSVPRAAPRARHGSAQPADRARFSVLVIEDHAVNRRLAVAQLEALGYRAAEASDGAAALTMLDDGQTDGGKDAIAAVLLDCQMPRLDGYETARRWRRREAARGVARAPIIAITADARPGERERCLAVGMDDYLTKPFRHAELAAVLDRWLGISRPLPDAEAGADASADPAAESDLLTERVETLRGEGERLGRDLLGETVEEYLRRARDHLAGLRRALAAGDPSAFATAAHDLAGSSAMMGDEALADLAATLQARARDGVSAEALGAAMPELETAFERFAEALEPYRPEAAQRRR